MREKEKAKEKPPEYDWEISQEELDDTLLHHQGSPLLFGYIEGARVVADMETAGITEKLRERGYVKVEPDLSSGVQFGDRLVIWGHHRAGERYQLVDIRTRNSTLKLGDESLKMLLWEWMSFQDPARQFKRPPLPGQDFPGLGMFRQSTDLMVKYVQELPFDLVAAIPEYFHNAWLYSQNFCFRRAQAQGRFLAMCRDLLPQGLAHASRALDRGEVLENGEPFRWSPEQQVYPLNPRARRLLLASDWQSQVESVAAETRFEFSR